MRRPLRLVATAAVLATIVSSSASAENRTTIQISTVLASNEGRTFDARLSNLKTELRQLRFRSYKLLATETHALHGNGGQSGMELPHGRYLHISTREHTPDHLRLHILLNEDNRPVVNTYVKLELGSVVLLGGPRDPDGTLVITIGSRPWCEGDDQIDKPAGEEDPALTPGASDLAPLPPHQPAPAVPASMPGQPQNPGR